MELIVKMVTYTAGGMAGGIMADDVDLQIKSLVLNWSL